MNADIVELYIYDLSDGWCGNLGPLSPVRAIWHTSIVFSGKEYIFGASGIKFQNPAKPLKKIELGETKMTPFDLKFYIKSLKYSDWSASTYDPLEHNCNHFTDHIARYLGFGGIPEYILESMDKLRESSFCSKVIDMLYNNGKKKQNDLTG